MRLTSRWSYAAFWTVGSAACVVLSCAKSEDGDVQIVIQGGHSLEVGGSLTLVAETRHGTDHGYGWSSVNEGVAIVDGNGLVTGVAPGETVIVARGDDTDRSAEHVMVVEAGGGGEGDGSSMVPFYEEWQMSGHADASSPAFTNWDEDGEIPTSCAGCHSREGFRDFLGDDGSERFRVNQPAPTGSVVDCETCHNVSANELDTVIFPSGVQIDGLGGEARCMTCHQGRGSGDSVEEAIVASGAADDEVSEELSFLNIHNFPAAATLFAGQVRGGYQYAGLVYDRRFRHVPEQNDCIGCHDAHSTKLKFNECSTCHPGTQDVVAARDIRMLASLSVDQDGDGNTEEGIYFEIQGLREKLYTAIQRYASEISGQAICYGDAHPYWYKSGSGGSGECADNEINSDNRFDRWTPRLLRGAYNYQMARRDPGAYAHNSPYVTELLHDSIVDLNVTISEPVDMAGADRNAPGHFDGASEAARNWDEDEAVSENCSRCHSGALGYRFFVEFKTGVEIPETGNGLECYTCHENFEDTYDVLNVTDTVYPDGREIEHDGFDNLCATCHTGRASKGTIDEAIAKGQLGFKNVHYLPAAGVRNGSQTAVGYEYDGQTYAGTLVHANRAQCTACHAPVVTEHTFLIDDAWDSVCATCHADQGEPRLIRQVHLDDYDGDGNTTETLADELAGLDTLVLLQMQVAAPSPICYGSGRYPYWFVDDGASTNGLCADTATTGFANWNAQLMQAAHNHQLHTVDPGAYAHNFAYMAQLLFDSIANLGGDTTLLIRPAS